MTKNFQVWIQTDTSNQLYLCSFGHADYVVISLVSNKDTKKNAKYDQISQK